MTIQTRGQQAYATYRDLRHEQGVEVNKWPELSRDDQKCWHCVTASIAATVMPAEAAENAARVASAKRGK